VIRDFDYTKYGEEYFRDPSAPSEFSHHRGYSMAELLKLVEDMLAEEGIWPEAKNPNKSPGDPPLSDKYFDCIDQALEARLLEASETFMDLMYKHTPMLSFATAASMQQHGSNHNEQDLEKAIEEEKLQRMKQAKVEHQRLFEKNKAKGKYCDINSTKVFKNKPKILEVLKNVYYKPNYRRFDWKGLTDELKEQAKILNMKRDCWDGKKRNTVRYKRWKELRGDQRAAAFVLGWDEPHWNCLKQHKKKPGKKQKDQGEKREEQQQA